MRHPRWAVAGAGLIVLSVSMMIARGYFGANPATTMKWLPDWAVVMQAKGFGDYEAEARSEILNRLTAGTLGTGTIEGLINHALERQGDLNVPWEPFWGEVVEIANQKGFVAEEQWKRYISQGVIMEAAARPRVVRSQRLPIEVTFRPRFGQLEGRRLSDVHMDVEDDWQPEERHWNAAAGSWLRVNNTTTSRYWSGEAVRDRDVGQHTVQLAVMLAVAADSDSDPWLREVRHVSLPFEIVEEDPVTPASGTPPLESIRSRIKILPIRIMKPLSENMKPRLHTSIVFEMTGTIAAPLAMRANARINGKEYDLGHVMREPDDTGINAHGLSLSWPATGEIEQIDIILRGDPAVARDSIDMEQYWDGEIIFENVPFTDDRKQE